MMHGTIKHKIPTEMFHRNFVTAVIGTVMVMVMVMMMITGLSPLMFV